MNNQIHHKSVLILEDQEEFYTPINRWLTEGGYKVTLATSYAEAHEKLRAGYFHLIIVDIRLGEKDEQNEDGLQFLADIEKDWPPGMLPGIVLSAHATKENVLRATQELNVWWFIEKAPGYRKKLLDAINEKFKYKIKINFEIEYDDDSDSLFPEIVSDIAWLVNPKPALELLSFQLRDLMGKLFINAKRLYINKVKAGFTGAAIIRVRPTWTHGPGPSYVVKISRRDKIQAEGENYHKYVQNFLPPNMTQLGEAYTQNLGALSYTFAERDGEPLQEFDHFYLQSEYQMIADSLRDLFQNTCAYWYDHKTRLLKSLPRLYFDAFQLTQDRLLERIHSILPAFDIDKETFQFEHIPIQGINPIYWLRKYSEECKFYVFHSITHGDLTGRNIMVDKSGKCWLIDFYRTYESHILRDFVILETDIKYRLLPTPGWKDFITLEVALLEFTQTEGSLVAETNMPPDIYKAQKVILALRAIGHSFSVGASRNFIKAKEEYLISLLVTTLNIVRLRHIETERKLQAMLSASLICAKLDELAGRSLFRTKISDLIQNELFQKRTIFDLAKSFFVNASFEIVAEQGNYFWIESNQVDLQRDGQMMVRCFEKGEVVEVDDELLNREIKKKGRKVFAFYVFYEFMGKKTIRKLWEFRQKESIIIPIHASELEQTWFEASDVQDVFAKKLISLRRHWSTLIDSYASVNSLNDPQWFFGKQNKAKLERIFSMMLSGINIAIFGMRRVGKTTLVNQLLLECEKQGLPVAKIISRPFSPEYTHADLLSEIMQKWISALKILYPYLETPSAEFANSKYVPETVSQFVSDFNALRNHLQEKTGISKQLLLILDEVDHIFPNSKSLLKNYEEYCNFGQILKSILESTNQTGKIVILSVMEYPMINNIDRFPYSRQFQNPLYGRFRNELITVLSRSDWNDMVETIGALVGLSFSPESLDFLFAMTAGHPEITRKLGSCLIELRDEKIIENTIKIEEAHLATEYFLEHPETYAYILDVTFWNDPLCPDLGAAQSILRVLAKQEYTPEGNLNSNSVREHLDSGRIANALEYLLHMNIVIKNIETGNLSITMPIYRDWIVKEILVEKAINK